MISPERRLRRLLSYGCFEAARLKIARARYHIERLRRELETYHQKLPIRRSAQFDPPYLTFKVEVFVLPPIGIPTIIGDAVHNLRCSLDLLASDVVRLNGKEPADVYFPFARDAAGLEVMIKKKHMDRAPPAAVDLVRQVRPYRGGNLLLRTIHDLDIADKHQALIPAASIIQTPESVSQFELFELKLGVESGGRVYITQPMTDTWLAELGDDMAVPLKLLFPDDTPFAERELITGLEDCAAEFLAVVEAFEVLLFGAIAMDPLDSLGLD
ncbi:MAG: hypothetical protein EOP60_00590 [Sphingomonadales bacterium]|nr:MAG: hypothetical protein EOP60_00590 [Sphingomonadales bacterium]